MDILFKILLMLHLFGLVLGLGAGLASFRVRPMLADAEGEQRGLIFSVIRLLGKNGHIGLGILWVTGIAMVAVKYQDIAGLSAWFWVKMVLVLILSAAIGMTGAAYRRAKAGDASGLVRAKVTATIGGLSGIAIIAAAVMAFN